MTITRIVEVLNRFLYKMEMTMRTLWRVLIAPKTVQDA